MDVESTSATLAGQAAILSLDVSLASALTATGHTDHMLRVWDSRLQHAAHQGRVRQDADEVVALRRALCVGACEVSYSESDATSDTPVRATKSGL